MIAPRSFRRRTCRFATPRVMVAFPNAGEAWGFVVATVLATAGGHHAVSANKSHAVRRIWAAH
jgi:hypothetical protein